MDFTLADSDCWDSNPFQDNFIRNYSRKRNNSGVCESSSEPPKKKDRKSYKSSKKSNEIVWVKNYSSKKNIDVSNHIKRKSANAERLVQKAKRKNSDSINLNEASDLSVINNEPNSIQLKFMKMARLQSLNQKSQNVEEYFKTNEPKIELEVINNVNSALNIVDYISMKNNYLTKTKQLKKMDKKKFEKQEMCKKAALNSFQTTHNDNFTKDEYHKDKMKARKSIKKKEKVTKNNRKDKFDSKVQSLSVKLNETESDEEIDKALEDELKNSKEFLNLKQFLNEQECKKSMQTDITKISEKMPKNEDTIIESKKKHPKTANVELHHTIIQRDKLPPNKESKSCNFKSKVKQRLQAAKFRLLNEKLYTVTGNDALEYFQNNVDEFIDYHTGYCSQVMKWPINPVDVIIKDLYRQNKSLIIADMGCGEAKIASTFPDRKVYSFDLVALNKYVTCCDISKVNLQKVSVDILVFCLSLMGTNVKDYLTEAHRILKFGGQLKIAEVESRIDDLDQFAKSIESFGFTLVNKDVAHKMFIFLDFNKVKNKLKKENLTDIVLKPCLYKKR